MSRTLFDKIWDSHVVKKLDDGRDVLFMDRQLLHEVTSPQAYEGLLKKGRRVLFPQLTLSTEDHVVSTEPGRSGASFAEGMQMIDHARVNAARFGIAHFEARHRQQGIVHVMAPELGVISPGMTVVCGDSHTCTLGALGAVAFGIGTSEVEHVLATQSIVQARPKSMRVWLGGEPRNAVSAKDVILRVCRAVTVAGGTGYAIEYAGPYVAGLGMEGRFTLCNMSIEMGARIGIVAPDQTTFDFLADAQHALRGLEREEALRAWRELYSDDGAAFASELRLDISKLGPQITWGTNPDQVVSLDEPIESDGSARAALAFEYMGLRRGDVMLGQPIDTVFIGSCTNGRLGDLRAAAQLVRGGKVDPRVRALVVPGSQRVKRLAEEEGIADTFRDAGFEWREPGCSMCASINRDFVEPGQRSVSTTNRNFVGRQGPGARTHLASPLVAAASALAGEVADPGKA
jgi:3-isopropylmalate/(R)-2-methylmalate dehydratase large subunit